MVAAYSPHRDGGAILHLPSPTHIHHVDPASALRQLRRSLSRSPSKGPTFRLVTSNSTSPSPSSPLSPSPLSPHRRLGTAALSPNKSINSPSPLAIPFPPSAKKTRANARRPSPVRGITRSASTQRNPIKRGLSDSTDHGNATPASPAASGVGVENRSTRSLSPDLKDSSKSSGPTDTLLAPHHAFTRFERGNGYLGDFTAKSSPLKRSDGIMNLEQASLGSPSAKRRSLHGASFGPDFDIFDHEAAISSRPQFDTYAPGGASESNGPSALEQSNAFSPLPRRTSSLRKSTLQQRYEKPTFARSKPNTDLALELTTPAHGASKGRPRVSLETFLPPLGRDSLFAVQGNLPSASMHPISHPRKEPTTTGIQHLSQRHPLSRTINQSSSGSSLAEDSPTHILLRQHDHKRPTLDFSKSLPVVGTRPDLKASFPLEHSMQTSSTETSFATPENYKLAKPLPAAFMSTGLISKRHKNMDMDHLEFQPGLQANMPDTPCKRPNSLVAVTPAPVPEEIVSKARHGRHALHSFGTPSTPFNPHIAKPASGMFGKGVSIFGSSFGNGGLSRRGSFLSIEGDDIVQPLSGKHRNQSSAYCEVPPAPSKQTLGGEACDPSRDASVDETMPSPSRMDITATTGAEPTQFGQCSKSTPERTPCGSVDGDSDSVMEDSPSTMLRFKSFATISSYSTRSRLFRPSHSPTPLSKKSLSVPYLRVRNMRTKPSPLSPASPLHDRCGPISPRTPHTPQEYMLPPDPSGLSISAHVDAHVNQNLNGFSSSVSVYPPATPTTSRDYFPQLGKGRSSITPVHSFAPPEVDPSLVSRFNKVEMIGTGEFSQVYRVSQKPSYSFGKSNPTLRTSPSALVPDQVWAVKKSRRTFIGPKDRLRKLQEVEILKILGRSDHTVQLFGSWEHHDYLYIQTEFCEEGSLDIFLDQVGRKARLDDFRIWKIMLELSLVKHTLKGIRLLSLLILSIGPQAHS